MDNGLKIEKDGYQSGEDTAKVGKRSENIQETDEKLIEDAAKRILTKYIKAFEELAK